MAPAKRLWFVRVLSRRGRAATPTSVPGELGATSNDPDALHAKRLRAVPARRGECRDRPVAPGQRVLTKMSPARPKYSRCPSPDSDGRVSPPTVLTAVTAAGSLHPPLEPLADPWRVAV